MKNSKNFNLFFSIYLLSKIDVQEFHLRLGHDEQLLQWLHRAPED
jgi:hypothetical protein